MRHEIHDRVGLEIAKRVVARLREQPDLVNIARNNIRRWQERNAESPSLLACYREWEMILQQPFEEVCVVLCADTDEGRRLRQNSPFVGVLPPGEIWEIKRSARAGYAETAA